MQLYIIDGDPERPSPQLIANMNMQLLKSALFALCLSLFTVLIQSAPIVIYLHHEPANSDLASDYRSTSSQISYPQARLLGQYFPGKYLVSTSAGSDSIAATKRNIAIGRGDGFRPGK
ncbi:hypothetical protein DdX_03475 [Ditylenchus destructor]|uniref:Uncharacterized protein n=1 Tax=Ditylenchus destructor TaxID=166010 RepID=A0AAD4NBR3_9BILA|nr:hypothetical protein DdX_03475 [Ditylenchus destructor]